MLLCVSATPETDQLSWTRISLLPWRILSRNDTYILPRPTVCLFFFRRLVSDFGDGAKAKLYFDPVHGQIELDPAALEVR